MYNNRNSDGTLMVAARWLNIFSALVILVTGVYVQITFADVLSVVWKLVVALTVLGYVIVHVPWTSCRRCGR